VIAGGYKERRSQPTANEVIVLKCCPAKWIVGFMETCKYWRSVTLHRCMH
jgi:hypothetical protein